MRVMVLLCWLTAGARAWSGALGRSPRPRAASRAATAADGAGGERKRVVFLGTPSVAARSLRQLIDAAAAGRGGGFEIVGVVTQPPARARRGRGLQRSPVHETADDAGLTVLAPESARDADFLATLADELAPDLCITAAYGQFLPKAFLATPKFGTLNVHPSLLPRWRGAAPVQRSVEAGDATLGVSVLETVLKMDAGPVLATVTLGADDARVTDARADELLDDLFELGTDALIDVLPAVWAGTAARAAQDEAAALAAPKLEKHEGALDLGAPPPAGGAGGPAAAALVAHNKCRAFAGWPGTTLELDVAREGGDGAAAAAERMQLKVLATRCARGGDGEAAARAAAIAASLAPREVVLVDGVLCALCDDGSVLEMTEVQPPNKKPMAARAFWNGLRGAALSWVRPERPLEDA